MKQHTRTFYTYLCSALLALACVFPLMSEAAQAQDVLTFTSVSHNFGSAAPNSSPIDFGIKVTNTSSTTNYLNFQVNLTGSSDFSTANNCPASIAPGASCELLFIFTPGATPGTVTGSWNLTGTGDPTFSYSPSLPGTLTGQVVTSAGLTLSTSAHNFGTQLEFTTGTTYGVVLTNSTQDPVAINVNLTPSGYQQFPFQHNNYNCPSTLAAGQSCNLQWQFYPNQGNGSSGQPTPFTATFGISGTDTTTGQPVIVTSLGSQVSGVTLTGYGITGSNYLLMSTAKHNFGNIANGSSSSTYGIQLINTRPGPIVITISSTGNTAVFPITADSCFVPPSGTTTLASGQSCQVQFYFHPTTIGVQTANYNLSATSSGNPVTIIDQSTSQQVFGATLTGTSVGTTLTLSSGAHPFGPWVVGTTSTVYGTTLTYPYCGSSTPGCGSTQDPINLSFAFTSGSNTADFNLISNNCPAQFPTPSAPPAAPPSCMLTFTFSPQSAGAFSALYDITATDAVTHQPVNITAGTAIVQGVSLTGNGQASAELALATSSHNFGEQGVGGTSATYGTVLYNTTGATVNLSFAYTNSGTEADFPGAIPLPSPPGGFTTTNCPAALQNNQSCNIQFKFTPQTAGPLSQFYSITATSFGSPVTIYDLSSGNPVSPPGLSLSGTGVN